jgi:hypothetical protein
MPKKSKAVALQKESKVTRVPPSPVEFTISFNPMPVRSEPKPAKRALDEPKAKTERAKPKPLPAPRSRKRS